MKKKQIGRNRALARNTVSGIALQVVTVICGFILPRAILVRFGSGINGVVNSVTQFLQIIAFLELGVGAVVKSSLYKPLSGNDYLQINRIIASANSFFRKIAIILSIYVACLIVIFPFFVDKEYGFIFDATLILAISVSFFAQYFFGIVDRLLLAADQKSYIQNNIYIISLIINTAICYLLIIQGFSIQIVKLTTSAIFLLRIFYARMYINKNYSINRSVSYEEEPIKQKWYGIAQHLAAIVLDGTDIVVLSLFSTMANVSIYSIYNTVVAGLRQLFETATTGISALFGELWARNEKKELEKYFTVTESVLHYVTLFIWLCTYRLILPFVGVYTSGVTDANYNVPIFAYLICLASAFHCLRLTYLMMILAAGNYKQTQHIFITAACINLFSSCILVFRFGLIGVAIGTIAGMVYQTLHMQYFCIKKLGIYSYRKYIKQLLIDSIILLVFVFASGLFKFSCTNFGEWILIGVKECFLCAIVILLISLILDRNTVSIFIRKMLKRR